MAKRVNPDLIKDIEKYGAFDITACFNCGNCTAVCPLSDESSSFPRPLIRYAHLGLKNDLLNKKEMWMCYYCGDCSKTCPRQAEPGEFMAALRRYTIAQNDITKVSSLMYKSWIFNLFFSTILAFFFAIFIYAHKLKMEAGEKLIEVFHIPFEIIHNIGIVILSIAAIAFIGGYIKITFRAIDIREIIDIIKNNNILKKNFRWTADVIVSAIKTVLKEVLAFKRFQDCDKEKEYPLLLKPWFLHASVAWGFMVLFLATILDFLFKDPELLVPLWYPPRLIGTIGGIFLMYGAIVIIFNRIKKTEKSYSSNNFSDWWFIVILFLIGLTGFMLEFFDYFPHKDQNFMDTMFLIHVGLAMELIITASFTKLAHVFYRPYALFLYELKENLKK